FFQAEDGIRDLYVTGVQTCALPICIIPTSASRTPPDETSASLPSAWPGASGIVSSETTDGIRSGRCAAAWMARLVASPFDISALIGRASCRERVESSEVAGPVNERT